MINKKILILGKGFIGERLQIELNCQITDAFIKSFRDVNKLIKQYKPKVIIYPEIFYAIGKPYFDIM